MTADVLREAARLMRERAEVATVGPWEHTYGGIFVAPRSEDLGISYECQVLDEDDLNFSEDDAAHIASWHPVVARAVADCLDAAAVHWPPDPHEPHEGCPDCSWLAVARAYLNTTGLGGE